MQQMEALHQDQSMSQQDKMAKMKSLRDDSNTKIEAVLNDTQKQQFEQMQAKQQQRWQQKQGGQTGGAPGELHLRSRRDCEGIEAGLSINRDALSWIVQAWRFTAL